MNCHVVNFNDAKIIASSWWSVGDLVFNAGCADANRTCQFKTSTRQETNTILTNQTRNAQM
jgi:hypothetical protein